MKVNPHRETLALGNASRACAVDTGVGGAARAAAAGSAATAGAAAAGAARAAAAAACAGAASAWSSRGVSSSLQPARLAIPASNAPARIVVKSFIKPSS